MVHQCFRSETVPVQLHGYENPDFLEIICDILLYFEQAIGNITKEVSDEFDLREYKIELKDIPAFRALKALLCDYYILIQDFHFDADLWSNNPREYRNYHLSNNEEKIKIFRGVLFEAIIEAFVKSRYLGSLFETGCVVLIDNNAIEIFYNGDRKRTIDIAGWDGTKIAGEFYECKIRPTYFTEGNYRLLFKIENALRYHKITKYKIVFASADSQEFVENKMKEIKSSITYEPKCIELYGRNRLFEIRDFAFSEIA